MAVSERQIELTRLLDEAARVYEQEDREIISNFEYDKLYDELKALEEESGTVLNGSPTIRPGYEVLSSLPKYKHENPCLSLDKTKEVEALASFLKDKEGVLSWKMDGLTVVLFYENGELIRAVTRGNGEIGEVITPNAKVFKNVPLKISFKGNLVIRGEAVIKYSDFEKINAAIEKDDEKYKNPRNLCSGSVRQLNSEITAKRNVHLFAFTLFEAYGDPNVDTNFATIEEGFRFLEGLGFNVVERKLVNASNVAEAVKWFSSKIQDNDFPSDGLVLFFDDIEYGKSLGRTSKFPRNGIAFKWKDETATTTLREIEWSASRTGLINPVAIFDSVELEGTTVSRASLHNVSVMEGLKIGIGDQVTVYKANMIIPQIAENLTKSGNLVIPNKCPVCAGETCIKTSDDGVKSLYCTNPECTAKKIKSFAHFVSRDALNIEGLSEATMETFIAMGFIHEFADLFKLSEHKDRIISMDGFGEKSYQNAINSIEKAKNVNMANFIYALGIPNIGLANAKLLVKEFDNDFDRIRKLTLIELTLVDQIGSVIAQSFVDFMSDAKNIKIINDLLEYVVFEEQAEVISSGIGGLSFVITGSVNEFANRNELKAYIEARGGKVLSAVSNATNYLINNDVTSNSSKNKKAKELGVQIISEADFLKLAEG